MIRFACADATGLSPRVRRNRIWGRSSGEILGSISACAEEPVYSHVRPVCDEVYLRVCGGTRFLIARSSFEMGLSPRVRRNRPKKCDYPG